MKKEGFARILKDESAVIPQKEMIFPKKLQMNAKAHCLWEF